MWDSLALITLFYVKYNQNLWLDTQFSLYVSLMISDKAEPVGVQIKRKMCTCECNIINKASKL